MLLEDQSEGGLTFQPQAQIKRIIVFLLLCLNCGILDVSSWQDIQFERNPNLRSKSTNV